MIKEVIATGRDANAAIEAGCLQLGVSREEVEFDILSLPKKSFFGLRTQPAKVRVYIELPDPKPEKAPKAPRPPKEAIPAEQRPQKASAPVREPKGQKEPKEPKESKEPREPKAPRPPKPSAAPAVSDPAADRQPAAPEAAPVKKEGGRNRKRRSKADRAPRPETAPREQPARQPDPPPVEITPDEALVLRAGRCTEYLQRILAEMGVTGLIITPKYYEGSVSLRLEGEGLGVIIGRRGETLDALQYLVSLIANRNEDNYLRINIDSGNFRQKRERTLENLARKLANQAVRTGKSTTLEPMNPYERRIIHGAVSQVKGAVSSSVGVDPNRKVIISAANPPAKSEQSASKDPSRSRRRGGSRGSNRGKGPRHAAAPAAVQTASEQPAAPVAPTAPRPKLDDGPVPERTYTPKPPVAPKPPVQHDLAESDATKGVSLYGKIDI